MANEITEALRLTYTGSVYIPVRPIPFPDMQITQAVKKIFWSTVTAAYHSTDGAAIPFTNITTKGYAILVNLDGTNFVELGTGTGTFVKSGIYIPPLKRITLFFQNAVTPTWRADTADCQVMVYQFNA